MAAAAKIIQIAADCPFKIKKLKVKKGQDVSKGTLLCLYTTDMNDVLKFKSCHGGTINNIHVKEGQDVEKGSVMFTLEGCTHPTVMKDMCASCGMDLRVENSTAGNRREDVTASVAMVHSIPELIVSEQMAKELGKADQDRLLSSRKLVLVVDLDQTIIHTTMNNIPANIKEVKHFQLAHLNHMMWHHTKFRPGTLKFLEEISKLFELHICTFGSRMYAHTIAKLLDPEGKFFSNRILSRDECFDSSLKVANLKALFPCGDSMVCIIDDREDVWSFVPNMVHVKPYRFFEGTGDINAPQGKSSTDSKTDPKDSADDKTTDGITKTENNNDNEKQNETNVELDEQSENIKESTEISSDTGNVKDDPGSDKSDQIQKETTKAQENEPTDGSHEAMDTAEKPTASNDDKNSDQVNVDCKESSAKDCNQQEPSAKDGNQQEPSAMDDNQQESSAMDDNQQESSAKDGNQQESSAKDGNQQESSAKDGNQQESVKVPEDIGVGHAPSEPAILEKDAELAVKEGKAEDDDQKCEKKQEATELPKETKTDQKCESKAETREDSKERKSGQDQSVNMEANKDGAGDTKPDKESEEIEWDDEDDYLFYLEDILKNIHKAFYDMYDQMKEKNPEDETKSNPSLKDIIPYIKKKVLKGCNIVFSGIIPTNIPQETNRAYLMATSLGANIQQEIQYRSNEKDAKLHTTHLIAARMGTNKVRTAIKCKHIKIISVKWLWSCYERWEKVEESLFLDLPLAKLSDNGRDSPDPSKLAGTKRKSDNVDDKKSKKVKFDILVDESKEGKETEGREDNTVTDIKALEKVSPEPKPDEFSMTYNPLYAFSDDDIAYMDKEVEDEIDDGEDESEEEEDARNQRLRKQILTIKRPEESSSEDSMTGDMPRGWGLKGKVSPKWSSSDEDEKKSSPCLEELSPEYESETDQDKFEKIMEAFGPVTSSDDDQESIGSVDEEMADAVMKEFLS